MPTPARSAAPSIAADAPALLDSLLYSVSHDLRSPLLSVSLSAQLIEHALGRRETSEGPDPIAEALGGLKAACDDLERMLAALNAVSRAARRRAEPVSVPLASLCDTPIEGAIALDDLTAQELRLALAAAADTPVAAIEGASARVTWSVDRAIDGSSALAELAASLQRYAGTSIEHLACLEVAFRGAGGSLAVDGNVVTATLPLAGSPA
jgi:hypothetical protein